MHRVFMPLALTLVLATSACAGPDSAEQSALAGGAVGAGVGVVGTAVTGGCIWCGAALALSPRQRARLLAAAEILLAEHPVWGSRGVRFDVLLVDVAGAVRRITDAFRAE